MPTFFVVLGAFETLNKFVSSKPPRDRSLDKSASFKP